MGSHKHGISGYAPRSPRYKHQQTLENNKRLALEAALWKAKRRLLYSTVHEAVEAHKREIWPVSPGGKGTGF